MKKLTLKNKFLIPAALVSCAVFVLNYFYITHGGLLFKTVTSFGFVIIGLIGMLYSVKSDTSSLEFPFLMLCGLIFSMVGDVTLNLQFIVGALIFAMGHVTYFFAYSRLHRLSKRDLIICASLFLVCLCIILFAPAFQFDSALIKVVIIFYSLVISCMLGKAISNLIEKRSLRRILIVIGSALFFVSDFVLFLDIFGGFDVGNLCLATYYPAQVILGLSIFER